MTSSLAALQPFLDELHDASVRNPMLDELHQPFVGKTIEGSHDTLPIISTFPSGSLLFVLAIRSRAGRSMFLGRRIGRGDCISF
jgi:hypothetical protein